MWPKLKTVEVKTIEVERKIPLQNRPQPVSMNDIYLELKRYLQQQKEIIVYYEKAITPKPKDNKEEKK